MSDRLSMIVCSGTEEKLLAASVIAGGVAALGSEVAVLLQFSALDAFRASRPDAGRQSPADTLEADEPVASESGALSVPAWAETLRQSKAMGTLTIHACSASMDELGLDPSDLDPVVDGVSGIASFLIQADGGELIFI